VVMLNLGGSVRAGTKVPAVLLDLDGSVRPVTKVPAVLLGSQRRYPWFC
jgi:hypothetical protein